MPKNILLILSVLLPLLGLAGCNPPLKGWERKAVSEDKGCWTYDTYAPTVSPLDTSKTIIGIDTLDLKMDEACK